jgi:acetyl-CoA synthetase
MPTKAGKAPEKTIEALLLEKRRFKPPKAFAAGAHVKSASIYKKADANFQKFWAGFAKELDWIAPWKKVLDWKPPKAKWCVGGK